LTPTKKQLYNDRQPPRNREWCKPLSRGSTPLLIRWMDILAAYLGILFSHYHTDTDLALYLCGEVEVRGEEREARRGVCVCVCPAGHILHLFHLSSLTPCILSRLVLSCVLFYTFTCSKVIITHDPYILAGTVNSSILVNGDSEREKSGA